MSRPTSRSPSWFACLALALAACGDDNPKSPPSPYDDIAPSQTLDLPGLTGAVDVVRDRHGVPHVHATNDGDAFLAHGYVVASDRWLQLDLLRHLAKGRIGELFGALDAGQIDSDLAMRMHRFTQRADAQIAALRADTSPDAQQTIAALDQFAAGVNAWLARLRAGQIELESAQAAWVEPANIEDWTASDSVAIGLLQAWSLSYDDSELALTQAHQTGQVVFAQSSDPARRARARAFDDLFPLAQLDQASTIDGWPTGGTEARTAGRTAGRRTSRAPHVPRELLQRAMALTGPVRVFGLAFNQPEDGSNNWVVSPSLAGGTALVANDPHLQLSNPPVFHYVHLTVPEALDVAGVSLAGMPGVILGRTSTLAWGSTTSYHDVLDFFLEDIHPCAAGGGDCVTYDGAEVKLESFEETIKIGAKGTILDQFTVRYEVVPHHGPILPEIVNHRIVPRSGSTAISVKYTGYQPTRELLALARLDRATTVAEGFTALDTFDHGSQNWVMADAEGHIGWTTTSRMPVRSAGCRTWNPGSGLGTAPWFVLPGDGSCKWESELAPRDIPHSIDPAKGYLVTANADPVGESFDGDPLNGPHYAGFDYGPGFRAGRITRRLEALKASGNPMTIDDMTAIQADTFSSAGHRLRPFIVDAATKLLAERATPGTHPELAAFAASLDAARVARIQDARDRLAAWTLEAAAGGTGASATAMADAVATTIFNFWQIEFYDRAFGDELELLGEF
ncbi:MAG: penicillin acylase family protein, partial [Kofleriaceae bacterium]